MSFKYYSIHLRTPCCLLFLPLTTVFVIGFIMARRAGDLSVAQIPVIQSSHIQRALELKEKEGGHVVVIGAGASGVSAAYALEYLGVPYTVLEASGTMGGRVREMDDFVNLPLDLGAEFIHVMPRVLQDLLLLFDDDDDDDKDDASLIGIIKYQPTTFDVYARGKRRRRNWMSYFYQEYKFANTTWWSYFDKFMYPYIADRVEFNAVVKRIEYMGHDTSIPSNTSMLVTTTDGRKFTASHVILTVPIPILQDRDITFSPDLDAGTWKAVDDMVMADGMKVWFEFDQRFWPDFLFTKSILRGMEGQPFYFDALLGKPDANANVLCLFNVNTNEASKRAAWTDNEIVQNALDQLEDMFDRSDLRDHLVQSRVQNWSQEPHIRGAYTWNYGEYNQKTLRKPLHEGHLFLAGEHIAKGREYSGTVHGAAVTGREAVLNILETKSR